jgi:signal recognition particle subunit SRP54
MSGMFGKGAATPDTDPLDPKIMQQAARQLGMNPGMSGLGGGLPSGLSGMFKKK